MGVCVGGVGVWRSLLSNRPFTISNKQSKFKEFVRKARKYSVTKSVGKVGKMTILVLDNFVSMYHYNSAKTC